MSTDTTLLRCFRSQRGVSMVELMVAMLLGLLLTGGAIQVFVSNRAAYSFNEGMQRIQENGRFALDSISHDVRMAGFLGCMARVPLFNNLNSVATPPFNFAQGITGYEAVGTAAADATFAATSADPANSTTAADWSPALPAPILNSVIKGSDVLVIRAASTVSYPLVGAFADAGKVYAGATTADFAAGDVAIVSDCQKASVFQVTAVVDAGGGQIDLSHAAAGTPANLLAAWDTDQTYSLGAQVARADSWVYYVGARGVGLPPALFRMRLQTTTATVTSALAPEELVEGVDTMQITYGIDSDLDGDLDTYQTAPVADWSTVVAVRVGLLLRSPDEYGTDVDSVVYVVNDTDYNPVNDRRVRQIFTTTAAIRNRLP